MSIRIKHVSQLGLSFSFMHIVAFVCLMAMIALTGCSNARMHAMDTTTTTINYQHNGQQLQGVIVAGKDVKPDGRTPGVLIVHEWWGLNDYIVGRAQQMASLGYVAMALDMYGEGRHTTRVDEAQAWSGQFYGNPLMAQRAKAGLDQLASDPRVDPDNIIVMGYCFGGTTAIELAYSGANLKGAVSFHGTPNPPTEAQAKQTKAALLILTGEDDPMFAADARKKLVDGLEKTDLDWKMVVYPDAVHAFTNPGADKFSIPGVAYNREADLQSFREMTMFIERVLGEDGRQASADIAPRQ